MVQDDIKALNSKLKGHMALVEATQIFWEDIVFEIKKVFEHLKLVAEKRDAIKATKFFVFSSKEEDAKNANTVETFIKLLNEKLACNLRVIDIIFLDRCDHGNHQNDSEEGSEG